MRHVRPLTGRGGAAGLRRSTRGHETLAPTLPSTRKNRTVPAPPQHRGGDKRVRRGKQLVSASFDLHGHTQDTAWRLLPQFLAREQARGAQCVIVITGKGRYGDGVLRRNFLHWLDLPEARGLVSGFAPAHARHGGGGAWYVFLRKR